MAKKPRKKKGQNRFNRQWVREHSKHRNRLPYGEVDKMTGKPRL